MRPLSEVMMETLKAVSRKGEADAVQVMSLLNHNGEHKQSAINNRLRKLMDLGLLKRERKGPHLMYSLASTK